MLIPIGDDQVKGGYRPWLTYVLIVANVLIFLVQTFVPEADGLIAHAMVPGEVVMGVDLYAMITSMFLHGSWIHLIGNMLFLWIFGDNIEATVGTGTFFLFYLIGGLFASVAQIMIDMHSAIPVLGASGAIAALMGAYMIMFPKSRIRMILLWFPIPFRVTAWVFFAFYVWGQLTGFMGSTIEGGGVAYGAHLGGLAIGAVAGWNWRVRTESVSLG